MSPRPDDLVDLSPAEPTPAPRRFAKMTAARRARTGAGPAPAAPVAPGPAPAPAGTRVPGSIPLVTAGLVPTGVRFERPADDRRRTAGLPSFSCRVVSRGWTGGCSGTVFRAFPTDNDLLLVDTRLKGLTAAENRSAVAGAVANAVGGVVLEAVVGGLQDAGLEDKVGRINRALDRADEHGVRKYVREDHDGGSFVLPGVALRGAALDKVWFWNRLTGGLSHDAVVVVTLAQPAGAVTALALLALKDPTATLAEIARLSGDTARASFKPREL